MSCVAAFLSSLFVSSGTKNKEQRAKLAAAVTDGVFVYNYISVAFVYIPSTWYLGNA
jgi:hypothetical protein